MSAAHRPTAPPSLTDAQRRLIHENLGLVGVHLRNIRGLAIPRCDREWSDLFQEGCLGLIRAAVLHPKHPDVPFAAFALKRIRHAVSRALSARRIRKRGKMTVQMTAFGSAGPADRRMEDEDRRGHGRPNRRAHRANRSLGGSLADRCDPRKPPPGDPDNGAETVGERLRAKYERAVRKTREMMADRVTHRDRRRLACLLEQERFLIPDDEAKRSLRQIARDTGWSYASVAECDREFGSMVRDRLDEDPEFDALRRWARAQPEGSGQDIDDDLEGELIDASAAEFLRRLTDAEPAERARMLGMLLGPTGNDLETLIRDRFAALPPTRRERLFQGPPLAGESESNRR